VKLGCKDCARDLSVSFRSAEPLTGHTLDKPRADRYRLLRDALELNPDLRFPNLDKVLPLPPAALAIWDGKRETLVDAAKPLVAKPAEKPTPGSQRTGRAHIPQGHVLRQQSRSEEPVRADTHANHSGYWLPRLNVAFGREYRDHEAAWERAQVPQRYDKGEAFETMDRSSMGPYAKISASTVWHYLGEASPVPVVTHPRVAQGLARASRVPEPLLFCKGMLPCPRTGVWGGQVAKDHPLARLYNRWDRFAYVEKGQSFPDPRHQHIDVAPQEVKWLWLDNANQRQRSGIVEVTLSDLHEAKEGVEHG